MSRARNLAGFVTAISPVTDLNCGIVSAIRFVGPFDVEVGYAQTAGIATYAATAGIATVAEGLTGTPDIVVGDINATGDVSVAGTISYLDVTDVNAIGIITAQQGIDVTGGDVTGNNSTNISGINSVTATEYYGDGSNLVLDYQDLTIRNWMFGPG